MRRRILYSLFALTLAAVLFRAPLTAVIGRGVARVAARQTLVAWGLEPTRENIQLYLAADHARLGAWIHDQTPIGRPGPLPVIPAAARFSPRRSYGDLFAKGHVVIGIYNQDPSVAPRLAQLAGDYPAGPGRTITVRRLLSRADLLDSLARDTFVLYFGHANHGQGIRFDPQDREPPLRLDDATLAGLEVNSQLFGYFGCRTDLYFRDIWQRHFPQMDFLGTTYVCHTTILAPEILRQLVEGLQSGRALHDIVAALNQNKADAILFGRLNEVRNYQNSNPYARALFTD